MALVQTVCPVDPHPIRHFSVIGLYCVSKHMDTNVSAAHAVQTAEYRYSAAAATISDYSAASEKMDCAHQAKSIQSLCEKNIQPKIIRLEGIVFKRSLINYKNTPQDMFIRKIQFTEHLPKQKIISDAADAKDFAAWQKTVYMPLYLLRMLCLINLIWLGSLSLQKPLNSSST